MVLEKEVLPHSEGFLYSFYVFLYLFRVGILLGLFFSSKILKNREMKISFKELYDPEKSRTIRSPYSGLISFPPCFVFFSLAFSSRRSVHVVIGFNNLRSSNFYNAFISLCCHCFLYNQ